MKGRDFSPILSVVLLSVACAHRQDTLRVFYVPSPPSSVSNTGGASSANRTTGVTAPVAAVIVIQEPEPPSPPPATASEEEEAPTPPSSQPRRRHRPALGESTGVPDPSPETASPPTPVPPLEAGKNPQQQDAQRQKIQGLQQSLQGRIGQLEHAKLSGANRKTLDDARAFLAQSGQALEQGDLQRSLVLAQKAGLMLSALDNAR